MNVKQTDLPPMTDFTFQAIDSKGKTKNGKIVADNSRDARKKLSAQSLTVLKIKGGEKEQKNVASQPSGKSVKKKTKGIFEGKNSGGKAEKAGLAFLKRLLELHSSGMPVADAVKTS